MSEPALEVKKQLQDQKKKSSLVSGNRQGENHSPTHIVEYVSEYTFLISKNNKQTNKKTRIKENKRN